jgi:hypothetical protein
VTADVFDNPKCGPFTCEEDCSHLFWHCTSCDESGGYGLTREELDDIVYGHNNAECVAIYEGR